MNSAMFDQESTSRDRVHFSPLPSSCARPAKTAASIPDARHEISQHRRIGRIGYVEGFGRHNAGIAVPIKCHDASMAPVIEREDRTTIM